MPVNSLDNIQQNKKKNSSHMEIFVAKYGFFFETISIPISKLVLQGLIPQKKNILQKKSFLF